MVQTGTNISPWLSSVAIILPLIAVFIIIATRTYKQESINFLLMLSLVFLIANTLLALSGTFQLNTVLINNTFALAEFVILLYLFKTGFPKRWMRDFSNLISIAFLSVVITIYSLEGFAPVFVRPIQLIEAILLTITALFALVQLIRNKNIFIFQSPMFWIAGGTFCYYGMLIFIESVISYRWYHSENIAEQKKILLDIINLIRYCFYIIAAFAGNRSRKENISYPY